LARQPTCRRRRSRTPCAARAATSWCSALLNRKMRQAFADRFDGELFKPRQRSRGTPPPLPFDLDALPASTKLKAPEVAAVCRRSLACVEKWRQQPDHPLRGENIGGRILYEIESVRAFLRGVYPSMGQEQPMVEPALQNEHFIAANRRPRQQPTTRRPEQASRHPVRPRHSRAPPRRSRMPRTKRKESDIRPAEEVGDESGR
jgi:hypothetical protein